MSDPTREELRQAAEFCINNNFCDECVFYNVADCLRVKDRALLAALEREEKNIDVVRFRDHPPCYLCGYNGPGYFQPDKHKCAAYYHAAIKAAEEGRG